VSPDVCVIGEINPDLIVYGLPKELEPEREILADGFRLTLGSSSAIFAHNLSALSTRVGMISKIGTDPLGKIALDRLIAGGVDVSHVRTSPDTPTGVTVILAQPGSRFILTYPGTMFELSYDDLDFDYIFSARHLHLSSFFLHRALRPRMAQVFRAARSKGLTTSLDTNDDPEDKWDDDLAEVLRFIDILFVNEPEATKIARTDDLNSALAKLAQIARLVVVKRGAQGAIAREGSTEWRCLGLAVDVIDTVGAGDSFDAGYIHSFLQGGSRESCLQCANAAGAFSTTKEGGTEAFRDRASLAQFFREHPGASPAH
jgi:sugar/nucleoside kinase (ribokinase family)